MMESRSKRWAVAGLVGLLSVGCGGKERTSSSEHDLDTPASSAPNARVTGDGPSSSDASAPAAACPITGQRAPEGSSCNLLGEWSLHSEPWNGLSTDAKITFCAAGTLIGEPAFTGKWSLTGSSLAISATEGVDMTCQYEDDWTLTFSDDCNTAPLVPVGSGCTGARRYLDWNVTMTRP